MFTSLDLSSLQPARHLKVTLLVEALPSGRVAASIFEFPTCRVEAETKEGAIALLQDVFWERLQHIEAISWTIPVAEPAWMQFAGIFKDDPDFTAIMENIRAERLSEDESEVDPSYYQ